MNDSKMENYRELWTAIRAEKDAEAEKLSAERRMEYNRAFDDFGEEVDAIKDWTAASWDQFKAKVDRKWQEFALDMQE
jgi:hypothetical protein